MTVFKNYFKIAKAHRKSLLLYAGIFFLILIFSLSGSDDSGLGDYSSLKVDIYLKDESNTDLSKALYNHLEKNCNIIKMDENLIEDSLFYGEISSIVIIPEDFENTQKVEYKSSPKDISGMLVENHINQFLNQVNFYERAGFERSIAIENANKDLDKKVKVVKNNNDKVKSNDISNFYFDFLNYPLMSQIILIVSTIMLVYKKESLYKRNAISPVGKSSQSLQLSLGHIVSGIIIWLVYMILYLLICKESLSSNLVRLLFLNSFVFTISTVCMSVFISNIAKNENSLNGIMNVVALGSSFLSGAFVPQEILSETSLKLARIFPSYYYITNNNMLIKSPELATSSSNMLIMLGFSAVFIILSIIIKPKVRNSN
ncbi:MAG: ABC transporter permease [Tissierellia bacterium]|nr:ABC transporter permease [Tissierellia bacterium]